VPVPVVQCVVRQPVVRIARSGQPDRLLGVVPIEARCAGRDCVPVWSAHAGSKRATATGAPNPPLQPTASRARSVLFEGDWQRLRQLNGKALGRTQPERGLVYQGLDAGGA
jgi:hypothetical protein